MTATTQSTILTSTPAPHPGADPCPIQGRSNHSNPTAHPSSLCASTEDIGRSPGPVNNTDEQGMFIGGNIVAGTGNMFPSPRNVPPKRREEGGEPGNIPCSSSQCSGGPKKIRALSITRDNSSGFSAENCAVACDMAAPPPFGGYISDISDPVEREAAYWAQIGPDDLERLRASVETPLSAEAQAWAGTPDPDEVPPPAERWDDGLSWEELDAEEQEVCPRVVPLFDAAHLPDDPDSYYETWPMTGVGVL